jgi:hypothetical protein
MTLKFGKCLIPYCPEKLNDREQKIVNLVLSKTINDKTNEWYEKQLYYLLNIQKMLLNFPNYNSFEIFGLKNHKDLFKLEDDKITSLDIYLKFLNNKYNDFNKINYDDINNLNKHFRNIILFLKEYINDPRPYQVLYNFNNIDLKVYSSCSSQTASVPGGHCFQGLFKGYLIYISNEIFFNNNPNELNRLLEITIDIGLHRNMAGLHFIYDNYISYILFMEILKEYNYNIDNKFIVELKKKLKNILLESID